MKSIEQLNDLAMVLVERDLRRNRDFEDYERMYHNDWQLPDELAMKQWIFSVLNTEPANKINAAVRAIARLEPSIKVQPMYDNEDSKEWANRLENVLGWNLAISSKRKSTTIWWDYALSALLYNAVAAQVIDLDYQIKQYKMFGNDTSRLEAARNKGRFMINVINPKYIHPVISDVMEEGVMMITKKNLASVYYEFGPTLAKNLKQYMDSNEAFDRMKYVYLYDYMDYQQRAVWISDADIGGGIREVIIEPQKNEYPFMPWVVYGGSSAIETEEEHKYRPLLYTVLKAGQWQLANITDSIITSRAVALSGTPVLKEEGSMPGTSTEIDYDDPLQMAKVTPGNQLSVLTPPPIDAKMLEVREYLRSKMAGAVPDVLVTLEPQSGEPYAGFALRMSTAIASLGQYIKMTELALESTLQKMICWSYYTDTPLLSFGRKRDDYGRQYMVEPAELDPNMIYIEVTMRPDTPTDKIGNINAAAIAVNTLGMSQETALSEIGIENPQAEMKRRMFEKMLEFELNLRLELEKQTALLKLGQQQQAAQAQEQQVSQAAELQNIRGAMLPQGIPNVEGQGFNPAMGGMPSSMVAPYNTREYQQTTELPNE